MEVFEQTVKRTNLWLFALQLGFFAGLIWGGLKLLAYFLRLTKVVPGFMAEPFLLHSYLKSTQGVFAGWGIFTLFSVIASVLYAALFRKARGPWPGILYGLAWWVIWFALFGPAIEAVKPITELDRDSFFTELCLFILWGLFIGYTINFEFNEERGAETAG
jgi:hypothetical protein